MPIRYRSEVKPAYAGLVAEGMARYANHKAMKPARKLAGLLLSGALDGALSDPNAFTYQTLPAKAMRLLRDQGVTADQLLARVEQERAF